MPKDFIFFSSRILTLIDLFIFCSFFASLLKNRGVQIFGGVLPKSLAKLMPLDIDFDIYATLLKSFVDIFLSDKNIHFLSLTLPSIFFKENL